ncbi:6-phosphogluconate dehydrogenase [Flagellimonas aequoris]|uniref:6-phosphogluconate dehydrogenase n=1 Tax=Flagellimonas aequoris TaxID=2306997 RepID=A0A418N3P4_9FLAO|nr:6-phosphogluconate dehydrogenase [Allomuricauda aequoris]RIV68423.1 6-phosphogluconate dehydrogenase [Allomuricauda aequoris]TXK00118.1 6-phosphogluconate dehydrogenase [Allomuricauda aequoris]
MKKFLTILIAVIVLGVGAYFAFIYYVPYSVGYRSGELIKFSRKGVVVKTWEGQISQGLSGTNVFSFSVEDKEEDIIEKLKEYQGQYIKVTYKERYATFFWLGDTKYFITEVAVEKSPLFRN